MRGIILLAAVVAAVVFLVLSMLPAHAQYSTTDRMLDRTMPLAQDIIREGMRQNNNPQYFPRQMPGPITQYNDPWINDVQRFNAPGQGPALNCGNRRPFRIIDDYGNVAGHICPPPNYPR